MNLSALDWTLLRTFLAILEGGSLSAAARRLGLTHVTVRRHLDGLEATLGGTLFTRSQTGLLATDLARRIAPAADAMAAAAASLARTAASSLVEGGGPVRITASEMVGAEVLPPMLARLKRRHPALSFELTLTNAPEDLLRRDADVAVRMMRPLQGGLVARRIGAVPFGLYAHADWIAAQGLPGDAEALLATRGLIGQDRRPELAAALADRGLATRREHFGLVSDSDLAQLAAVRAGLGVGIVQVPLAARHPALVRILPTVAGTLDLWLVTHPDLRAAPRIRLVMEGLAADLAGYLGGGDDPRKRA